MFDCKQTTWEKYISAWKVTGAQAKTDALKQSVALNAVYQDPLTQTTGHEALLKYMLDLHEQMPGVYFVTQYFLTHHDVSIAKWDMIGGDGQVMGDGVSYGRYNEQGQLVAMNGFYEWPMT
jgi:hypothetical protein